MNRRGFTLIELLTVFSIIAILAAILFPVFAKAQEKARQASCGQNLQNIGAALRMYAADNYGHFPPVDNDLQPLLAKFLPDETVLVCPTLRHLRPIDYPPPTPEQLVAGKRYYDYVYRSGLFDDDRPLMVIVADRLADLHNDGANHLWIDGHAKWLKAGGTTLSGSDPQQEKQLGIEEINRLRQAASGKVRLHQDTPPPSGGPGA